MATRRSLARPTHMARPFLLVKMCNLTPTPNPRQLVALRKVFKLRVNGESRTVSFEDGHKGGDEKVGKSLELLIDKSRIRLTRKRL